MTKKTALLLLASVILGCSSTPPAEITMGGADHERVPLAFDKYGYLPVIEMAVGSQKVRLGIDTGANKDAVTIGTSALERLNVVFLKSQHFYTDAQAKGKIYKSRKYLMPSAQIGKIKIANLVGSENVSGYDSTDGFIGNGLLQNFKVLFDYPNMQMILYSRDSTASDLNLESWSKIPFHRTSEGIIVEGKFESMSNTLQYILDTGCTVHNDKESMGIIRPRYAPSDMLEGVLLLPQLSENELPYIRSSHFYLGGIDIGEQLFLEYDFKHPSVAGFIGHNFFQKHRVLIDFQSQAHPLTAGSVAAWLRTAGRLNSMFCIIKHRDVDK